MCSIPYHYPLFKKNPITYIIITHIILAHVWNLVKKDGDGIRDKSFEIQVFTNWAEVSFYLEIQCISCFKTLKKLAHFVRKEPLRIMKYHC